MVRKQQKYRWSERREHFLWLEREKVSRDNYNAMRRMLTGQVWERGMLPPVLGREILEINILADKISSIPPLDCSYPEEGTRFEREGGTTNPPPKE